MPKMPEHAQDLRHGAPQTRRGMEQLASLGENSEGGYSSRNFLKFPPAQDAADQQRQDDVVAPALQRRPVGHGQKFPGLLPGQPVPQPAPLLPNIGISVRCSRTRRQVGVRCSEVPEEAPGQGSVSQDGEPGGGHARAILKRSGHWARLQPNVKMLSTRDDVGRAISPEEEAALFNQAVNPPCAYSPYATCPLAAPENQDEKAGLRRDALSTQVIDAQPRGRTGNCCQPTRLWLLKPNSRVAQRGPHAHRRTSRRRCLPNLAILLAPH
jgi:hypothetical protein